MRRMSMTGFENFDAAVQKADVWLKDIMRELHTESKPVAYFAMRAVLHALRDRLPVDEAADFAAQLPLLIKGIYYDGWDPSQTPVKYRHVDEFLERIGKNYRGEQSVDMFRMAKVVFKVLQRKITEGEVRKVRGILPEELSNLWE